MVRDEEKNARELIAELDELRALADRPDSPLRSAVGIINASPVVVFLWRNEHGWPVDLVSDNVLQVFGYSASDFTDGRVAYADVVHPEDIDRVRREVSEHSGRPGCTSFAHEAYRIVTSSGETRWLDDRTTIVRDGSGAITHYQGIVLDITSRRSTEEALRLSREKYRRVYETAPLAFVVWDSSCLVTEWNERAEELFGWSRDEVLGRSFFEFLIPEAERPNVGDVVDALLAGELPSHSINTNLTKDRRLVTCEWNNAPLHDEGGAIVGALSLALDITDRLRHEEERARLEEQMHRVRKLESLSVLAGGIAHDFNNLLVGILGNAELALLELPPGSRARSHVKGIEAAAVRAADLAQQMLAYSGKGQFVVELLDLNPLVEEIVHLLELSISGNAALRLDLAPCGPVVSGDATQLRQILMNLITNASDAIDNEAGVIAVRTGCRRCTSAELSATYIDDHLPEGTYCFIEVSDTGRGIDDSIRSRIFEPFFTTKFSGRGLGLAGVLGIVRGHGGAIKVDSEPGRGTTFTILLPAVQGGRAKDEASSTEARSWSGTGKVLVVDDEQMVLEVARRALERLGYEVEIAHNGEQAVELVERRPEEYACVLLDLTMPGIGGEECFRRLRSIRADLRVILSSGYSECELVSRYAESGFSGFIHKPYRLETLAEAVKTAIGAGRV